MPGWKQVNDEIDALSAKGSDHDRVRRQYLKDLADLTNRNVIAYYSGWLQKQGANVGTDRFIITDADKGAFMAVIHRLDKSKGLDLILHSPGGDVGATESLGDYLRSIFGTDIRVIVPQVAMSCGTMLACLGQGILMGKHSSLGPVDPQFGDIAAVEVVNEFELAKRETMTDASTIPYWSMLLSKYPAALVIKCQNAIDWSQTIVESWLKSGMFQGDPDADAKAKRIAGELVDHNTMKAHNRHISAEGALTMGLNVTLLEGDEALQDAVLTVHHCYVATLGGTDACKIVENHEGMSVVFDVQLIGFRTE